jgi:hypothetical protein
MPVSDASLRYQTHLNLSAIATTHSEASRHALAAYWLFPYREALAALVNCAFQQHEPEKALRFANLLVQTPEPMEPLWCHEPRWYGWHGQDLYHRAQRLAGEVNATYSGQRIVLLHETNKDDARFVQQRDQWMSTAGDPEGVFHLFSVPDDQMHNKWFASFATCAAGDVVDFMADLPDATVKIKTIKPGDVPTPHWDTELLAEVTE